MLLIIKFISTFLINFVNSFLYGELIFSMNVSYNSNSSNHISLLFRICHKLLLMQDVLDHILESIQYTFHLHILLLHCNRFLSEHGNKDML
jgi:hypothetical protein